MKNAIIVACVSFAFALGFAYMLGQSYGEGRLADQIASASGQYTELKR